MTCCVAALALMAFHTSLQASNRFTLDQMKELQGLSAAAVHSTLISSYEGSATCLRCHAAAAEEVMETIHWTWDEVDEVSGKRVGKKTMVNNFCIAIASNEPRCTSCHVGLGYADKSFDFSNPDNVDCLVCHDTTGTYKKFPTGAGHPTDTVKEFPPGSGNLWEPPDLTFVAQNVGKSSRATCGACHFKGGGGNAVKHGTMDTSLTNPPHYTDVHMDAAGLDFTCVSCHQTSNHEIRGTFYSQAHPDDALCRQCHTEAPHADANFSWLLDDHTNMLACQTCHVPEISRGDHATKMWWDWSSAGIKNEDGKPFTIKNEAGDVIYDTKKGDFVWERNAVPEYTWFNGQVTYVTIDDTINPDEVVRINEFHGSIEDPNARIFPVKRFRGIQPYDAGNSTMAIPHLFGKDPEAYWKSYDWNRALAAGMAYADKPFSGEVGYVETEMTWLQNHMVAPKEQSLGCMDCHRENGRLDFAELGFSAERTEFLTSFFDIPTFAVMAADQGLEEDTITITFEATPGGRYKVQYSPDLANWQDVDGELLSATAGEYCVTWTSPPVSSDQRFFRVVHIRQSLY